MTSKEKANELFNKYFSEIRMPSDCEGCMQCVGRCANMVAIAQKYASIACQHIIESEPTSPSNVDWDDVGGTHQYYYEAQKEEALKFWQQVKNEIQLL
jgi:hypothetical protein